MRRSTNVLGRTLVLCLATAVAWLVPGAARPASPRTMQAMVLRDGRLTMRTVPVPRPEAGEVRIRVRAAGVNPADWKMARKGSRVGPDAILGLDASGTVDVLGPNVTGWKPGEAVIALTRPPHGSNARYAVVSTRFLARKPRSMSFAEAAGIPVAGITAWRSLIDYKAGPIERKASGMDIVLETANPDAGLSAMRTLKPGGIMVSIVGPMPPARCSAAHVRCAAPGSSGGQPATRYLEDIARLVEEGKYRVSVERTLPLRDAEEAWKLSREGHTQGKLVLAVP